MMLPKVNGGLGMVLRVLVRPWLLEPKIEALCVSVRELKVAQNGAAAATAQETSRLAEARRTDLLWIEDRMAAHQGWAEGRHVKVLEAIGELKQEIGRLQGAKSQEKP